MLNRSILGAGCLGLALAWITGCQTLQPVHPILMSEVRPGIHENIVIDHLFILADTSGSMQRPARFPEKKAFLQAFTSAMPVGAYEVAAGNFAGPNAEDWLLIPPGIYPRGTLGEFADHLTLIGGTTDMDRWLASWQEDVSIRGGRAAVLVLSDGRAPLVNTMLATKALSEAFRGQLCIFAVQFGDDPEGAWLLRELTRITGCGQVWRHEEVNTPYGLELMVRRIFFQGLPDSDGDGVPDIYDECPDTPRGAKVDERGCWVLDGILFDFDKSDIRPEFNHLLDEVAYVLQSSPGVRVRLEGHADARGTVAYNQGLSERRAESVRRALIDRGVSAVRLETRGYSELRPVRPNTTEANMALNRRVEITPIP